MQSTQDFIERYYPGYTGSDFIALWLDNEMLYEAIYVDDMGIQLIDLDKVESESARELYHEHVGYAITNDLYVADVVSQQHYYLTANILQRAIDNYIKENNHVR